MLTKVSIAAAASIMLGLGSLLALNACDSDHETKNVPLVSVSPAPVPAAAGAVAETVAKPLTVTDINKDIVQFSLPTGTTVTAGALYSTTGAGGLALLNVDKVDGAQVTARIVGGSRILKVGDAVGPWSPNTAAGAATSASDAAFQVLAVRLEKRLGMASVGANLGVARRAVVYIYRDGTLIATGRVEKVYADMCSFVLDPNVTARVAVHDRLAFTPATESTVDAPNASDISEDNPF